MKGAAGDAAGASPCAIAGPAAARRRRARGGTTRLPRGSDSPRRWRRSRRRPSSGRPIPSRWPTSRCAAEARSERRGSRREPQGHRAGERGAGWREARRSAAKIRPGASSTWARLAVAGRASRSAPRAGDHGDRARLFAAAVFAPCRPRAGSMRAAASAWLGRACASRATTERRFVETGDDSTPTSSTLAADCMPPRHATKRSTDELQSRAIVLSHDGRRRRRCGDAAG